MLFQSIVGGKNHFGVIKFRKNEPDWRCDQYFAKDQEILREELQRSTLACTNEFLAKRSGIAICEARQKEAKNRKNRKRIS